MNTQTLDQLKHKKRRLELADLLVIVLQYGKPDETLRCLEALDRTINCDIDVVVVDNASPDENAVTSLLEARPDMPLIVNEENLGFAEGNNRILGEAMARWLDGTGPRYALLLNNDVEVDPCCLSEMLSVAIDEQAGAVGAINQARGSTRLAPCGGSVRFPACAYEDEGHTARKGTYPYLVETISGSTLLLDLHALSDVGLLDAEYFCVYEETDLCLRLRNAGYPLYLAPLARADHAVGASTGRKLHFYFRFRNRVRFARKHGGKFGVLRLMPSYVGEVIWKTGGYLLTRRFEDLAGVWRGVWDGLHGVTGKGPYLPG